jgi:DNA-binding transcriptional LysR family regulator
MTEIKEEGALTGCGASGFLWVTAPAAFGRKVVTPVIPRLLSENPELRINFELTDSVVDIVAVSIECRCASGGYEILAYRRTFSEGPLWVTSGLCQGERLVKVTEPR